MVVVNVDVVVFVGGESSVGCDGVDCDDDDDVVVVGGGGGGQSFRVMLHSAVGRCPSSRGIFVGRRGVASHQRWCAWLWSASVLL